MWWGVSWKRLGDRMAGAKNRRKMKLLTAVYRTSRSSVVETDRLVWASGAIGRNRAREENGSHWDKAQLRAVIPQAALGPGSPRGGCRQGSVDGGGASWGVQTGSPPRWWLTPPSSNGWSPNPDGT